MRKKLVMKEKNPGLSTIEVVLQLGVEVVRFYNSVASLANVSTSEALSVAVAMEIVRTRSSGKTAGDAK